MNSRPRTAKGTRIAAALLSLCALFAPRPSYAQSICAAAKIELGQEAALEREGFTATLAMTNNLADQPLTGLRIELVIKDAEGNAAESLFFANVTSLEGAAAIDGTGTVQPSGTATTRWLIIPSPGAGGTAATGVRYTVQARMSMLTSGVPRVITTFPVAITVKPQPLLKLEYVLPFEVFGDEPFTEVHESTIPFPLGLRVSNIGAGTAKKFKVTSNQPLITDNQQGLAVDFNLLGTWLGADAQAENTLLLPFGDIAPGTSKQAAWSMTSSLSGRFVDFTSTFTHAAELGGALTSLIESVTTYTLIKDVLVDLPGRDAQFDFLVNATTPRSTFEADFALGREPVPEFLMESDRPGLTPVVDAQAQLTGSLSGAGSVLHLAYLTPVASSTWVHASVPAPSGGSAPLLSVTRADGKVVSPRNAWISKHFDKTSVTYSYFLHVLDYTGPESSTYALAFNASSLDAPPSAISDLTAATAGHGALDLSWTAAGEDGNEGAVFGGRYAIFVTTDSIIAPSVPAALISFTTSTSPGSSQSYRLTGLTGNATYYATVYAADAGGQYSAASNRAAARTGAYGPRAPAIIASPTSLEFSWLAAPDQPGAAYRLILSSGGSVADTGYVVGAASASFAGLSANTTYSLSAQARNSDLFESSGSVVAEAVTWAFPPSALPFAEVNETSATARWAANGNPDGTLYRVELSTLAGGSAVADSGWVSASSEVFQGLLPGAPYQGRVRARSHAGVETAAADLGAFTTVAVDTAPPSLALVPASGSTVTTVTPELLAVYADAQSGVSTATWRLLLDEIDVTSQTIVTASSASFIPAAALTQGTHTATAQLADFAGNVSSATAAFFLDSLAPMTELLVDGLASGATELVLISTDSLGFAATDGGAGVLETRYALDGSTVAAVFVSTFSLSVGTHTLAFHSVDRAGNAEAPRLVALTVRPEDQEAPTLSLAPPDGGTVTAVRPAIVASYGDSMSGIDLASVRLTLDSSDITASAVVTASSAGFVPAEALSQGSHTVTAAVADYAGNVATASSTFFLDSIAPQTTMVAGDPRFSSTTLFVTVATPLGLTASEPARTFYAVDSSTFAAYSGTFTLTTPGAHAVQFYGIDLAGNVEATRVAQTAVDGLPPRTAVSFGEPKFSGDRLYLSSTTKVQFTAADDLAAIGDEDGAGAARTFLSVDSGSFAADVSTVSLSSEGEHVLAWFSRDLVDNAELVASTSVVVDVTPPATRLEISLPLVTQASGTVVGPKTILSLSAQDPISGVKDTFLAISTGVFALAPDTFTLSGADGPRVVSFYSRDNVLNAEAVENMTVLLDATPPVSAATIGAPLYAAADGARYVTPATPVVFSAQDAAVNGVASGLDRIEVSVDGAAFAAYVSTLTFAEGRHVVLYRAVDRVGNVEAERELRLFSDATPPLTSFAPSGAFFTGADGARFAPPSFSYELPAEDPLSSDVASGLAFTRYSLDTAAFLTYTTTFTLTEGARRVDFQSQDNLGHLELLRSATVFVDATAPLTALGIGAPQLISSGTVYVSTATPFSLASQDPTVAGVASGVSVVSVRLDGAAFGPYLSGFTIPAPDGPRSVAWFAADNVGNAEAVKNASVTLDATAPLSSLLVIGGRQVPLAAGTGLYASSDTRVSFVGEDPITGGSASGLAGIRFQDNGGAFQNFTAPLALGEGRHALGYQGQDNVLNLEVLRSTTVLVDATPPVTAVSIGAPLFTAADGTIYVAPASSISFSAADPSLPSGEPGSGVERVEASLDGGAFAAFTAPLTFSEGLHAVRYRALDRVGNVEAERTLQLRSDAAPPASELAIGEPSFRLSSATVLVSSMTPLSVAALDPTVNGVASGVKETFYRFVDVAPSTAPFLVFTASFTFTGADGAAAVEFYSQDRVLNTEPLRSRALLLDSTRPDAAIDSPRGGNGICSVVKGMIPVRGTARDLHFASYILESAPGRDAAAGFVLVSSGAAAVDAGPLGTWDARGLSGWQTLRLSVIDQVRNASASTLSVFVGDPGRLLVLGNHETFNMPQGVAADADGRIYVADTNDDRVQVFSATGTVMASFGRGHGRDKDEDAGLRLNKPKGVAVDAAGAIYVADTHNDRVLKLSATGQILLEVGRRKPGKGPGEFRKPSGIAVDGNGNIFVADTDNNRVQKLGPDGTPLLAFNLPVAPGDGTDDDHDSESPELGRPVGIALDGAGNIYVADPRGARALKYSAAGQLLMTLPVHREGDSGKPGRPAGIAVSPEGGCILVSDQRSSRVIKFDAAGAQTLEFGERGNIKDNRPLPKRLVLRKPAGLALGADGKLYVADRNNNRIQVFGLPTGEPASVVPPSAHDHDDEYVARDVVDREDGGLVERDDRAGVSIPAGALAEDLKITVSTPAVAVESDRDRNRDEQNLKVVSAAVEYGPEGTKFKEPVILILPYTPDLLAAQGVAEDSLKINYWNKEKGEWEALESEVDKKNGTVKAKTPHFSLYQVLGSTGVSAAVAPLAADASFGFKDMYVFPNPVRGQGPVTIRIQPGLADSITVRVYDVSGRKIHESSNFVNRGAFDDGNGKGQQFTYDHIWDVSGVGSGVYTFVVTAAKGGERDIHKTDRVGIVK